MMTKQEWILRLRRCTSRDTLERKNIPCQMTSLSTLMPQWITDWRRLRWESYMTKYLLVYGNMWSKGSGLTPPSRRSCPIVSLSIATVF